MNPVTVLSLSLLGLAVYLFTIATMISSKKRDFEQAQLHQKNLRDNFTIVKK